MTHFTAKELLRQLAKGETTSRQLVDDAIATIERDDKVINAMVVRDFDRARTAASKADAQRRAGGKRPLLGLPVSVKEGFDVEGLVTSWGLPGDFEPAKDDAVLVRRLREAGAIVLGKTNVATMLADWQTANPRYGVTSNPLDQTRTSGGSSGGSAAAVAAGMSALEFGSDLAGSLRAPASFCGVFAHRPSFGVVPMRGFAPPMAPRVPIAPPIDQSVVGPLARSAADLALALDVVAGPDGPDAMAYALRLPVEKRRDLSAFKVFVLTEHPLCSTSTTVVDAVETVASALAGHGAKIVRKSKGLPALDEITRMFQALLMAQMGADTPPDQYEQARRKHADADDRNLTMSHRDWIQLDRQRAGLLARWEAFFTDIDLILCPAMPVVAFPHDNRPFDQRKLEIDGKSVSYDILPIWSTISNPAGLPATVVPYRPAGSLPVGIQLIGRKYGDRTTIRFAELMERELDLRSAQ